ncbi:AraC family transcriptional regulator [Citrobacter sp. Marseille-Q6884]|uniref:AraC family transcriptional regulator n=1 Tax=Citrobacter sp. Marseille-Q6884 TaxID=2956786 RepID=UPI0021B2920A|nr:AraC family transcriptional regulator [Citrobacter sp. Marseille-Q6884]
MRKIFSWHTQSRPVEITGESILLVKATSTERQQQMAKVVTDAGARYCVTGIHDNVMSLIFSERHALLSFPDDVQHVCLSMHPLCEIMAFLDESQQLSDGNKDKELLLNIDICSYDELIYWFICSYLMGNGRDSYLELLECIRRQESYFLTGYLFKNRCSNEKINTLCQTYGLSYSYFRKITKKYLGVSAKSKMSDWRLAQTILDILDGERSITEIALKNGYSSSAHVCSTFKSVLGISPYAIRKMNGK